MAKESSNNDDVVQAIKTLTNVVKELKAVMSGATGKPGATGGSPTMSPGGLPPTGGTAEPAGMKGRVKEMGKMGASYGAFAALGQVQALASTSIDDASKYSTKSGGAKKADMLSGGIGTAGTVLGAFGGPIGMAIGSLAGKLIGNAVAAKYKEIGKAEDSARGKFMSENAEAIAAGWNPSEQEVDRQLSRNIKESFRTQQVERDLGDRFEAVSNRYSDDYDMATSDDNKIIGGSPQSRQLWNDSFRNANRRSTNTAIHASRELTNR